jgi:NADPH2:quinone reductase
MKAIQIKALLKGTDELEVASLPDLEASSDRYVVQVQAAGTNFFDALQVQGKHQNKPPLPFIAGNEFAGLVLKTPTRGLNHVFKVGDRVFGGELGAFATQIHVKDTDMRRIPDNWTALQASGVFLTAPTAYAAMRYRANAQPGQSNLLRCASC